MELWLSNALFDSLLRFQYTTVARASCPTHVKPHVWPDLEAVAAMSSAAAAAAEMTSPCPASCALALALAAAAISAAGGTASSAASTGCSGPSGCSCQLRTSTTGTGCACWLTTHCATLPRCCGSASAWRQHWPVDHVSPDCCSAYPRRLPHARPSCSDCRTGCMLLACAEFASTSAYL